MSGQFWGFVFSCYGNRPRFGTGCISAGVIVPVPHAGHKLRGVRVS